MKYIEFKEKFQKLGIFSLSDITILAPRFHRNQLTQWITKGYIRKLKKGMYYFSDISVDETFLYQVANKLYTPSYLSMEWMLARYEFIPESVYAITSISTRKTKTISTDIGTFIYRNVNPRLMFGYQLEKRSNIMVKIASREKAILDFLYLNPSIKTPADLEEMRLNKEEILATVNWDICQKYCEIINTTQLNYRLMTFKEYICHA